MAKNSAWKHGGTIELNPEKCATEMAKLPQNHREAAARVDVPRDLDIPGVRTVHQFLPETRDLDVARLIANFMQGLSARAMDPGRWWWPAYEAVKQNPMNERSRAKVFIKDAIADLCKATRSPKKNAGLLRLPAGQGQIPVSHPTRELAWMLCVYPPERGGAIYFPHAGVIFRIAAGDAVLFPRAGGFGIEPIIEGYMFLMMSYEPPTPRLILPAGVGELRESVHFARS